MTDEIDAPPHAIAIWIEGDAIMVRFPSRHVIAIKYMSQLMSVLRGQAKDARKTVGTRAAPVQYDIDIIATQLRGVEPKVNGHTPEDWDQLVKSAGERQRAKHEAEKKRLLRKDAKRMARKEADETLALVGL